MSIGREFHERSRPNQPPRARADRKRSRSPNPLAPRPKKACRTCSPILEHWLEAGVWRSGSICTNRQYGLEAPTTVPATRHVPNISVNFRSCR
jgi:hypothetical protein